MFPLSGKDELIGRPPGRAFSASLRGKALVSCHFGAPWQVRESAADDQETATH